MQHQPVWQCSISRPYFVLTTSKCGSKSHLHWNRGFLAVSLVVIKYDNKKVTKVLYFPYLGGRPRWADSTLKLHGGWRPRRNHVCRVSNQNLHGLRFYRGSNFRFSYWILHGPYNSAALMRCLWWLISQCWHVGAWETWEMSDAARLM